MGVSTSGDNALRSEGAEPSAEGDTADATAGDFDRDGHGGGAGGDDEGEGFLGEAEREPFDEPAADATDALGVEAALVEVFAALFDPRLSGGPFFFGASGGGDAGQIAAADGGVFGDIAKDVDELESFAEPDAAIDQGVERGFGEGGDLEGAKAGPEFADATGDLEGVEVEFLGGGDLGAGDIGALTGDDGFEGLAHQGAFDLGERPIPGKDFRQSMQQGEFPGRQTMVLILDHGERAIDEADSGGLTDQGGPGGVERLEPLRNGQGPAVGESVSGAGQQVGERQSAPHRRGKGAKAQIK